jgi:hypothetical protein
MQSILKKCLVWAIFAATPLLAVAQNFDMSTISVTFATDKKGKTDIAPAAKKQLNAALAAERMPYYEVSSYYDGEGEFLANVTEAQARGEAVAKFLNSLGVEPTAITLNTFDESHAFAMNPSVPAKQRGKHIEVTGYKEVLMAPLKALEPKPQMFMFKPNKKDTTLTGNDGLSITIPAGAIKADATKPVRLVMKEYVSRYAALMGNMFSAADGKPLEMVGAYFVTMEQGGKPISLAKQLTYALPMTGTPNTGMQVYKGVKGKDGLGDQNWIIPKNAPAAAAAAPTKQKGDAPPPAAPDAPILPSAVTAANDFYSYQSAGFGWQSIAAPLGKADDAKVTLTAKSAEKGDFRVILKGKGTMVRMRINADTDYVAMNMPEGADAYIVGFQEKDGKILFCFREIKIGSDAINNLHFELATLEKLKKLEGLIK